MRSALLAVSVILSLVTAPAWGADTTVVVRAKAKDAMFVGTSMGGVRVTIRNAGTGELLAEGITRGGTGDFQRIMADPHERGVTLSTPGTAKFEATLDLEQPVLADIQVQGPLGQEQSLITASTQVWLLPGKDIDGDGVLLELPGFAVDVLEPRAAQKIPMDGSSHTVSIRANVVMMCGCPTHPEGPWDADDYVVEALVTKDGEAWSRVPLSFAGTTSLFETDLEVTEPGAYDVQVSVYDPRTGNTGVDTTVFKMVR